MTVPVFDVDRAGWKARSTVFDQDDPSFLEQVRYVVVHWGGGTSQIEAESEDDRLRIWQNYHIDSKGWTDIAYNYAFGDSGTLYRCRGLNRGGHVSCSNDRDPHGASYCQSSLGIVWVGGKNDPDGASPEAFEALSRFIRSLPDSVIVKGHRTVKQENGSWTECPGDDLLDWIGQRGWLEVANQKTTNPAFQPAFDKALKRGIYTPYTDVEDPVTAEKLAVFLDRAGVLDATEPPEPKPHKHTFSGETSTN